MSDLSRLLQYSKRQAKRLYGYGRSAAKVASRTVNALRTPTGGLKEFLWTLDAAQRIAQLVSSAYPSAVQQITVQLVGGPDARIERLWQMALAVGFGKLRESPHFESSFTADSYQGIWDITGKAVGFRIVSVSGGIFGAGAGLLRDGVVTGTPRQRAKSPNEYLLLGPTQEILGGKWQSGTVFTKPLGARVVVGGWFAFPAPLPDGAPIPIPDDTIDSSLNNLPDNGRMITSWYKFDRGFQSPQPALDTGTRSNFLSLVAATLTNDPNFFPARPPDLDTTRFTTIDPALYPSDFPEPANILRRIVQFSRNLSARLAFSTLRVGAAAIAARLYTTSWDGYKVHPDADAITKVPTTVTALPTPAYGDDNNIARYQRVDQEP